MLLKKRKIMRSVYVKRKKQGVKAKEIIILVSNSL